MQRLKTRRQFQAVLAGTIVAKTTHFVLHRNELQVKSVPDQLHLSNAAVLFSVSDMWIGAMVPKRWAKCAVTRNTIKRQIYTISADFSQHYREAAFVVRLRRSFLRTEFISARSEQLKLAIRTELQALMLAGAKVP